MSIELKFQDKTNYLLVHASGDWTTEAAKKSIRQIREEAMRKKLTHIFIDCEKVSAPHDDMTRYFTGEAIALDLGRPFKTVAVLPAGMINKLAEDVATNRGARILATHDYESAIEWLIPK